MSQTPDINQPEHFSQQLEAELLAGLPRQCSVQQGELLIQRFQSIVEASLVSESCCVEYFQAVLAPSDSLQQSEIEALATAFIEQLRNCIDDELSVERFLAEYSLDSREGLQLMSVAEALVRIPDTATAEALIESKLKGLDWVKHLDHQLSPLINATTRALLFGDYILSSNDSSHWLLRLLKKMGEPVVRQALLQGMKLFGKQFVLGHDLASAKQQAAKINRDSHLPQPYQFSYDMLGEAALCRADAERFYQSYLQAIEYFASDQPINHQSTDSVSIKLSALHPRYDSLKTPALMAELLPKIKNLLLAAKSANVSITIDAEESERLELSLIIFQQLFFDEAFKHWGHLGLAVQAYSKRAWPVLRWLKVIARMTGKTIPLRLVKGAYWDREIKVAQQLGLQDYPVFVQKSATDISYLACARYLLDNLAVFYPQFASHNAHTVASILRWGQGRESQFECQRLHGMGKTLYQYVLGQFPRLRCRIYAPIGVHKELLPYLIRRLLENGASLSFINQLMHPDVSVEQLARSPLTSWLAEKGEHSVAVPAQIFSGQRDNSPGYNIRLLAERRPLVAGLARFQQYQWHSQPLIDGRPIVAGQAGSEPSVSPFDHRLICGRVTVAKPAIVDQAVMAAYQGWQQWRYTDVQQRCTIINRLADELVSHRDELLSLLIRESGKTVEAAIAEWREAIDFCRYYAQQAGQLFIPVSLPGPTGEANQIRYIPRGVCACISPWNFPLAIPLGMISAALLAGNAVVAKPAGQSALILYRLFELMFDAGVPTAVAQLLPGSGSSIGNSLVQHSQLACVTFTGSYATARHINQQLAARPGPMIPLIAETGGQNAMLVDSSALPEQVVQDVISSAFDSAGQRCSALRVLYLQAEIADKVIQLLVGAMAELTVGNPAELSTDVGPVIDPSAMQRLQQHRHWLSRHGRFIAAAPLTSAAESLAAQGQASFFAPCLFEIDSINQLGEENFGPILHVIRYPAEKLLAVVEEINSSGYGLTFGIHSRNQHTMDAVCQRINAGNIYINRNMVAAVVGSQPFGGLAMSGTGPKAGGPDYLRRLCHEQVISDNVAAVGGNVPLLVKRE